LAEAHSIIMSNLDLEALITRLFGGIRQRFSLGMSEYLSALDVVQGDFGVADLDELKLILRMLWCSSIVQSTHFDAIWDDVVLHRGHRGARPDSEKGTQSPRSSLSSAMSSSDTFDEQETSKVWAAQQVLKPLALRLPVVPTGINHLPDLKTYAPISRRFMAYAWRYLRRPRLDGPNNILDISSTIDAVAKTGFFLQPVCQRREVNYAHLTLLIDRGGSMVPFHWISRDLIETAKDSRNLSNVDVYYFHNSPGSYVYRDPHLTQPVVTNFVWAQCNTDSSVLFFSDAGAARGRLTMERVKSTTEVLAQLQQYTSSIGWLNPMPTDRWDGSSAELIAYLVAMEQMDEDGFSNLIEIVRGQPLSSV